MPRTLAVGRKPAVGRQPISSPRKLIGFTNDGKPHVILDTNVFIDGLEAKKKLSSANDKEKACLNIIEIWEKELITAGINGYLYAEYARVSNKLVAEGRLIAADVSRYLNLASKATPHRVMVDQTEYSPHKNDDILFDGLLDAEYLISSNWKDVAPERLKRGIPYHMKIMQPIDFVLELKKLKIFKE